MRCALNLSRTDSRTLHVMCCMVGLTLGGEGLAIAQEDGPPQEPPLETHLPEGAESQSETQAEEVGSVAPQEPEESPEERRARLRFQQGSRMIERGLWELALAEFEASLQLFPTAPALFNRALCLHRLNRYQEAVRAFELFIDRHGGTTPTARLNQIQQMVDDIRAVLTEVIVTVSHDGSVITVDGTRFGTSPLPEPLLLSSGEHEITADLNGFTRATRRVIVAPGRPIEVQLDLNTRPRNGVLRILSGTPGAQISIDNQDIGAPPYQGELREGEHTVTVTAPGHRPTTLDVSISAGMQRVERVSLPRLLHPAWFYSVIGLAGAGVVAFAALGSTALYYDASYDTAAPNATHWHADGHRLIVATDITWIVTSCVAVAALVIAFHTDWRRRRHRRSNTSFMSTVQVDHLEPGV